MLFNPTVDYLVHKSWSLDTDADKPSPRCTRAISLRYNFVSSSPVRLYISNCFLLSDCPEFLYRIQFIFPVYGTDSFSLLDLGVSVLITYCADCRLWKNSWRNLLRALVTGALLGLCSYVMCETKFHTRIQQHNNIYQFRLYSFR